MHRAIFILAFVFACTTVHFARAGEGGRSFSMDVRAGILRSGSSYTSGWLPVRVRIRNSGDDFRAELLALNSSGTYTVRRRIFIQAGTKKTIWLYMYVGEYAGEREISDEWISVSMVRGERVLHPPVKRNIAVGASSRVGGYCYNILVLADKTRKDVLQLLQSAQIDYNGNTEAYITWPKPPAKDSPLDLPDRAIGYNSVDLIVFNEFDFNKLTPRQRQAIREWVFAGGKVLLSPGSADWLRSEFIRSLVPISQENIVQPKEMERLPSLEEQCGRFNTKVKFNVYEVKKSKSLELTDLFRNHKPSVPIFSMARAGCGRVFFLSVDIGKPPFLLWSSTRSMWQRFHRNLQQPPTRFYSKPGTPGTSFSDGRTNSEMCRFLDTSINKLPPVALISFLIIFYLVIVGPINYFTLKRMDKQILIVFTVPALAIIYLVIIFVAGYMSKGVTNVLQKLTCVEMIEGESFAKVSTSFSLYSSSATEYKLAVDVRSTLYEIHHSDADKRKPKTHHFRQNGGFAVEEYNLNLWALGYFHATSFRDAGGSVTCKSGDNQCVLSNDTDYHILRGILYENDRFYYVEDVPPKGQGYVKLDKPGTEKLILEKVLLGEEENSFDKEVLAYFGISGGTPNFRFVGLMKKEHDPTKIKLEGGYDLALDCVLLVIRRKPRIEGR
jgi:hypothetical protein